jgi:hypothetical protein
MTPTILKIKDMECSYFFGDKFVLIKRVPKLTFSFSSILGQSCPEHVKNTLLQQIQKIQRIEQMNDKRFTFDVRYICAHDCFSKYFQRMNFRIFLAVIFFNKNRYCRCKSRRRKSIIKSKYKYIEYK